MREIPPSYIFSSQYSRLYRISRMGGPGSNGGGTFFIGEIKISRFFKLEKFQKMFKKSMKNL